jgi:putative flippase GtrA
LITASFLDFGLIKLIVSIQPRTSVFLAKAISILILAPASYTLNRFWIHPRTKNVSDQRP